MTMAMHKSELLDQRAGNSCVGEFSLVWRAGVHIVLVCLFTLWASTASAADALTCEMPSATLKWREFQCPLMATGKSQQLRFKVDFAGSHDDTELSMTLTLDGVPVVCRPGSRTWLNGEDGNVSLECHFELDGTVGTKKVLGARVNIWHAQLVGLELRVVPPSEK